MLKPANNNGYSKRYDVNNCSRSLYYNTNLIRCIVGERKEGFKYKSVRSLPWWRREWKKKKKKRWKKKGSSPWETCASRVFLITLARPYVGCVRRTARDFAYESASYSFRSLTDRRLRFFSQHARLTLLPCHTHRPAFIVSLSIRANGTSEQHRRIHGDIIPFSSPPLLFALLRRPLPRPTLYLPRQSSYTLRSA